MKRALLVLGVIGVAHADERCVVEKPPITARATARPAPCHKPAAAIAKAITAAIVKAYHPEHGGTPRVTFPCDRLAKVYEIVVEHGSGHGGSLGLWRAKRRADGRFDARGIVYRGNAMTHKAAAIPHQQAAGIVALPALDTVRAAMTANVTEVVPPRKRGEGLGMSSAFSSRDFHLVIRLVDDAGRVVEKRYTGYATSSAQDRYLGLEVAFAALAPIHGLAPDPGLAADDDDRRFFAAAFTAAVPFFDDEDAWWVMERYVDLARFLGTRAVIGGLLPRLTVKEKDNRSQIDARAHAVDALAKITGWDARTGTTVEAAAQAYLAACSLR